MSAPALKRSKRQRRLLLLRGKLQEFGVTEMRGVKRFKP